MSTILTLPRLGETMESGRVVTWVKHAGDAFRRGETLVEIESDKTVVELPALSDGRLVEILAAEGTDVAVGDPLCRYEEGSRADAPLRVPPAPSGGQQAAEVPPAPSGSQQAAERARAHPPYRPRATPLARRLARQHGLALADLTGTGRRGRIDASDVRAALVPAPAAVGAFAASIALAPIAALGERLGVTLAVEDCFIKAASRALRALPARFPLVSIGWPGEAGEVVLHDADRLALGTVGAQRRTAPVGAAALCITWIGRAGVRPVAATLAEGRLARLLVVAAGAAPAECLLVYRADALSEHEAAELLGQIQDAVQDPLGLLL